MKRLTMTNGDVVDCVECENADCEFWATPEVAPFAFQGGCPWCGE